MQKLRRILCQIGIHQWSPWHSSETTLEAVTGHDVLDSIDDELIVETLTRSCDYCGRGHIKQLLKW